jgi:hypothetical protein
VASVIGVLFPQSSDGLRLPAAGVESKVNDARSGIAARELRTSDSRDANPIPFCSADFTIACGRAPLCLWTGLHPGCADSANHII